MPQGKFLSVASTASIIGRQIAEANSSSFLNFCFRDCQLQALIYLGTAANDKWKGAQITRSKWYIKTTVTATSSAVSGLNDSTLPRILVKAKDAVNLSVASNTASIPYTPADTTVPTVPSVRNHQSGTNLSWTVADNVGVMTTMFIKMTY
jgi:hypothetical protein